MSSLINFFSSFILASIYEADAFGYYAKALSLATIGSFIFTLRADLFSVEEKSSNDIFFVSLLVLTLLVPFSLCIEGGLIILVWSYSISLFSICTYECIAREEQLIIGYFRFLNAIFIVLFQLAFFYLFDASIRGLYYGAAIGTFVVSVCYSWRTLSLKRINTIDKIIQRYKVRISSYVIATISWLMDNVILFVIPLCGLWFFNAEDIGHFNFAERFFKAPIGIVVSSIIPFFISSMSSGLLSERELVLRQWGKILIITLPIIIVANMFLLDLIIFMWGEKWSGVDVYILPLSIFYVLYTLAHTTSYIYVKKDKYIYYLVIQIGIILSAILSYIYVGDDIVTFYWYFVVGYSFFQILNVAVQMRILREGI